MTTQDSQDRADADLRALLTQVDPEAGAPTPIPYDLLDRVLAEVAGEGAGGTAPSIPADADPDDELPPAAMPARSAGARPSFVNRHWQGLLMAAASVATLALAAGTIAPGLAGSSGLLAGGSDSAVESQAADAGGAVGAPDMAARDEAAAVEGSAGTGASTLPGEDSAAGETENTLVRWGSLLVGTEDVEASRNAFVATVLGLGGRVTSETVVTEDGNSGVDPSVADSMAASRDMGMSYPYPWYPSGPGVWLSVEVPVEDYDEAMEAARSTGEVIQMQQSSYDVGAQISDVDARIAALEASLARLTALMDEATGISDVIALEAAIAQRQAELDSLRAQQRELANQTSMSQISLTLMSPEDARNSVDPQPEQNWWESFLEGLGEFWSWLGQALLIVSPLLIAGAIIAWVRRRRRRAAAAPDSAAPAPGSAPAPAAPTAPDEV
jgi:hypothetical protein